MLTLLNGGMSIFEQGMSALTGAVTATLQDTNQLTGNVTTKVSVFGIFVIILFMFVEDFIPGV